MTTLKDPLRFTDEEIDQSIDFAAQKLRFVNGFREQQRTCLKSFLRGHDLFVTLPTGFGKSAVFQASPLCVDFFFVFMCLLKESAC